MEIEPYATPRVSGRHTRRLGVSPYYTVLGNTFSLFKGTPCVRRTALCPTRSKEPTQSIQTTFLTLPPLLLTLISVITESLLHRISSVFFSVFTKKKKIFSCPQVRSRESTSIFFPLSGNPRCCNRSTKCRRAQVSLPIIRVRTKYFLSYIYIYNILVHAK